MSLNVGNTGYNAFVGNDKIATAFVGNQCVYASKPKTPAMLFENGNFYWDDYTMYKMTLANKENKTVLMGSYYDKAYVQFNNVNFNGKSGIHCWDVFGSNYVIEIKNEFYYVDIYDAKTNERLLEGEADKADVQNYVFPIYDVNLRITGNRVGIKSSLYKIKVGEE